MTMTLRSLSLCALAALLCSCAATSLKKTWKSPDCQQPVGKIAVLVVEERGRVRQAFENRLVAQLARGGEPAVDTYDLLTLSEIKQDKRAAAARLTATGAEAVLILRLVGKHSSYHEVRAGSERYAPTLTGLDTMGWYDYYSVGFVDLGVTYGNLKELVDLEAVLYDLKSEKRLWSGLTRTVVRENMDRVAEVDSLVAKIVTAMRQDGVVR